MTYISQYLSTLKIKAPGMADMPGESQEEPSVMVIAILCDDPINLAG